MKRIVTAVSLLLLAGSARGGCDNPSLVIDENATGVNHHDCWQVDYVVQEGFPAGELLKRLTGTLVGQGWQKLDYDPVEPAADHPVHTWTTQRATDEQETRIDQWLGWYVREDGSRLQVTLRYFGREADDHARRSVITTITYVSPEQWDRRPR